MLNTLNSRIPEKQISFVKHLDFETTDIDQRFQIKVTEKGFTISCSPSWQIKNLDYREDDFEEDF
jgi:hypothetical protein